MIPGQKQTAMKLTIVQLSNGPQGSNYVATAVVDTVAVATINLVTVDMRMAVEALRSLANALAAIAGSIVTAN